MSTLSPKGQVLIRAGRRAYQATDADRERLLGRLRSQLGDAALPADMGSIASSAAAAGKLGLLLPVMVVSVGILGGALFYAWPRATAPSPQPATAPAPILAPQPSEPVAAPVDQPATLPAATPPAVAPPALPVATAHRSKDRLAAEVALLSRATRDLRAGQPAEALRTLDDYRRQFPKGVLNEEQRAARVQALCALGRADEAKAKLAELAPASPLAARAKQFCDATLAH